MTFLENFYFLLHQVLSSWWCVHLHVIPLCITLFIGLFSTWVVAKDISKLPKHQIEVFINEPPLVRTNSHLYKAYKIALNPASWLAEEDVAVEMAEDRLGKRKRSTFHSPTYSYRTLTFPIGVLGVRPYSNRNGWTCFTVLGIRSDSYRNGSDPSQVPSLSKFRSNSECFPTWLWVAQSRTPFSN